MLFSAIDSAYVLEENIMYVVLILIYGYHLLTKPCRIWMMWARTVITM